MLKLSRFYAASLVLAMLVGMIIAASVAPAPAPIGGATQAAPVSQGEKRNVRIVVVSHGQVADPFWSVVKRGVDQAATDMCVMVEYQASQTFDMVAMGQLIEAAVASKPDGLVVSISDADALGNSI